MRDSQKGSKKLLLIRLVWCWNVKKQILRPDSQRPRVSFEGLQLILRHVDILLLLEVRIVLQFIDKFFGVFFEHRLLAKCHSNSNYEENNGRVRLFWLSLVTCPLVADGHCEGVSAEPAQDPKKEEPKMREVTWFTVFFRHVKITLNWVEFESLKSKGLNTLSFVCSQWKTEASFSH